MNSLLLRKALRDVRRRRSQISAVAVTVFLGIFLFAANNDAAGNLGASYRELYQRLDFADLWATGGPTDSIVATLSADPDVTAVATRTRFDTSLKIGDRQLRGTVIGIPVDPTTAPNHLLVLEGTALSAGSGPDSALVEQHGWNEFQLQPGDTIQIDGADGWHDVAVTGGAASAEYVWLAPSRQQIFTVPDEFAVVFVPETLARSLAPAGTAPQIVATVRNHDPALASGVAAEAAGLGANDVYGRAEQASNQALQSDVVGFQQLSFLFPLLFLTVAGMAAFVLLSRLVRTERPQIGMMVANGVSSRTIWWHYATHAALATLGGALPGLALGVLAGRWISGLYTGYVDVPITVIRFSPATIAWSVGFVVVVVALAGGLPARAAARTDPAEAMRPPAPARVTRRSLIERLWPGALPGWARMVVRNVTRSRRRFASTAAGVVLAMVLVITSLGLADTVFSLLDRAFTTVDRRDLTVTFDQPLSEPDLALLAARPDVAAAEPTADAPAVISAGGVSTDQLLQAYEPGTVAHGFPAPLPDRGLVLSAKAARSLAVAPGDTVTVTVASLGLTFDAPIASLVDEPVPSVSYVSVAQWEAAGGPVDTAVVMLTDRSLHRQLRDQLQTVPGVVAVVDQQATVQALRSLLGLTYVFVGLMLVFALVMAVALIYNMVSVSLAERTGEVATLEANGVGRSFIRRTVTAENLLTIAAGIVPGTVAGWLVARAFVGRFQSDAFAFTFVLRTRSVALAICLVLAAALLAQWPGIRSLSRLDLATVMRERSE